MNTTYRRVSVVVDITTSLPSCRPPRATLLLQYLNGDHRFSLDTILELGGLLLQAYRGDHVPDRDSVDHVVTLLPQICPPYAMARKDSNATVDLTAKIDPLAPMADALLPTRVAERIVQAHRGKQRSTWAQCCFCVWTRVCARASVVGVTVNGWCEWE